MRGTSRPVRRPDPPTDPEIGLEDLQDNPNVSVSTDSDGTVRVVNGAFTDTTVTDAVDAAQVIDAMSELIERTR